MADIDVRVLGTSFNLSGYTTNQDVSVTLVSGEVTVHNHQLQQDFNITPGMRFEYNRENHQVKMTEVDPELYISWIRNVPVRRYAFGRHYGHVESLVRLLRCLILTTLCGIYVSPGRQKRIVLLVIYWN